MIEERPSRKESRKEKRRGGVWADCPGFSGAVSPEKLHLGGGLGLRSLGGLGLGRLFLLGRLVLSKAGGAEAENESEADCDGGELLHVFVSPLEFSRDKNPPFCIVSKSR